jgi:hypothetical protein
MTEPWHAEIVHHMPPTEEEWIAMMQRADLWPPHGWCRRAATALAVQNRTTGAMGVLLNVPWRDRLTVYEVNIFDRRFHHVLVSPEPSGVPEHKYIDFPGMYDAGWWPD